MTTATLTPEILMQLPEVQAHLAREATNRVKEMQAAESTIVRINERELIDLAPLTKAVDAAAAKVTSAQAALDKAQHEHRQALAARSNCTNRAETARNVHRNLLRDANASTAAEWRTKIDAEGNRLRSDSIIDSEHETRSNRMGNAVQVLVASNRPSVNARLSAVVRIGRQLADLCATLADPAAELQALWDALPVIRLEKV